MIIENYRVILVILGIQGIQGIILVSLPMFTRNNLSILTKSKKLKVKKIIIIVLP
jgi:hypothetical protein